MIVNKTLNYSSSRYSETDTKSDIRQVDADLGVLFSCLQGRVRFGAATSGNRGENIDGQWYTVSDTGTINTEFSFTHNLGTVPTGYLITKINKAGAIYESGTTWTSTTIYLKCSVANATVTLFLLR